MATALADDLTSLKLPEKSCKTEEKVEEEKKKEEEEKEEKVQKYPCEELTEEEKKLQQKCLERLERLKEEASKRNGEENGKEKGKGKGKGKGCEKGSGKDNGKDIGESSGESSEEGKKRHRKGRRGGGSRQYSSRPTQSGNPGNPRNKLRQLAECAGVVSTETIDAVGNVTKDVEAAEDNVPNSDEFDEDLEEEYRNLNDILDLPHDTYSLTAIRPELPSCVKFDIRSGLTHQNAPKFSPLSRGYQGGAIAIAAFATTAVQKSRQWNEAVIDQIVEDGDTFYCESYEDISTDDRRTMTVLDLKRELLIQRKFNVKVRIEDAAYAGKFRSRDPTELHLAKVLQLFFDRHDAGILTSPVLNIAIWRDSKYYNVFDGQARQESGESTADRVSGSAKLFLVKDLMGVLYIILEISNVRNEPFVIYAITVAGTESVAAEEDTEAVEKALGKPRGRPSGYKIRQKKRAVVQGSYHLTHPAIPKALRGKGHLTIAAAAAIYSRLINANKWTTALLDLMFNQSNIYLIDLVRVLKRKLDDGFELRLEDLLGDIVLGVYAAKIKIEANVVPGQAKGKLNINSGMKEFFGTHEVGVLEIKKIFYAIWKDGDTYYFLDPFACDDEGFRAVDYAEAGSATRNAACVTMNSSVDDVVETVLENTGNKDKDPFMIHRIKVLYVKTGLVSGGPLEKVIYREKDTGRRPPAPLLPTASDATGRTIDTTPRARPRSDKLTEMSTQFPEAMRNVERYMMTDDEPTTFILAREESKEKVEDEEQGEEEYINQEEEEEEEEEEGEGEEEEEEEEDVDEEESGKVGGKPAIGFITGYRMTNAHRLILRGSKNCLSDEFRPQSRGRQGLVTALTALTYRKLKDPTGWRNIDVDQIVDVSNKAYEQVITWIEQGRPEIKEAVREELGAEGEEGEEEEEEEEVEKEEEEDKEEAIVRKVASAPSHLSVSFLPPILKLAEYNALFKTRTNVVNGDASPLANLAEALERYFERYLEVVLENKKLMYAIWKEDGKFFLFNPYGSDSEGWRLRGHPAALAVTDGLNELVDILYGIIEYNDPNFSLHFAALESIQPEKYTSPVEIIIPDEQAIEKFRTKFLPITDDDLQKLEEARADVADVETMEEPAREKEAAEEEEAEEEEEGEAEEEEAAAEEETEEEAKKMRLEELLEVEKPVVDPLLQIEEREQPDAPYCLNLALLTSMVKIQEPTDEELEVLHEEVIMEKMKYDHPPPYVMPPKKTLYMLLKAKQANISVPSLVSRFSVDSRLEIKKRSPDVLAATSAAIVSLPQDTKPSKMIKISSTKYLFSRLLPIRMMPLRAIDESYIQDKDDEPLDEEYRDAEESPARIGNAVPYVEKSMSELIPLGPLIKAPVSKIKNPTYPEEPKRKNASKAKEKSPANNGSFNANRFIFKLMFPNFDPNLQPAERVKKHADARARETEKIIKVNDLDNEVNHSSPEIIGFKMVVGEDAEIIQGNLCLSDRARVESHYYKPCYLSALLCILAKIGLDADRFCGSILDELILLTDEMDQRVGKLRYKECRWFDNVSVLDASYNVILKEVVRADPKSSPSDELDTVVENFLQKDQTGILVLAYCAYAFWTADDSYYFFDPYPCDEKGNASEKGYCCLMRFHDLKSMLSRIKRNAGESAEKPFRIYNVCIARIEPKKRKAQRRSDIKHLVKKTKEPILDEKEQTVKLVESEGSLIELAEWLTVDSQIYSPRDVVGHGFAPMRHHEASLLEAFVLRNDIATPNLAPFKRTSSKSDEKMVAQRRKPRNRIFRNNTSLTIPIDLCVIAWSLIYDPATWSQQTIEALLETSTDHAFDNVLASEDTSVSDMIDASLPEFEIANYIFRAVFSPLHFGTLYAVEGWNLAMTLKKIFDSNIYNGAIIVCRYAHVGVAKRGENYFGWWTITGMKILRMIASRNIEEFLKLIVQEIYEPQEIRFTVRIVTITYALKVDPDYSDVKGFHKTISPKASLAEIYRRKPGSRDVEAIFRPILSAAKPIFVTGTVALSNRDGLTEPRAKRCYFVALLAIIIKRDIVQSPLPGIIDKVLAVAESMYKGFSEPKFHTEHILRHVPLMSRMFNLRDCASPLVKLTANSRNGRDDFCAQVKRHLKHHFRTHTSGILHFANCCYGFWYSRSTDCYYYLDPYPCDARGRKAGTVDGNACLCIFSTVCQLVKHMCLNRYEGTGGFFIHRIHVDSINTVQNNEDPMWVYLDYHWNFAHSIARTAKRDGDTLHHRFWNNYAIEVTDLIYSVWGTIGAYDCRFGERAGKNRTAICIAILAMQRLCHPSRWSPAILDSAVICGDSYYTESVKSAARKCSKPSNRFRLLPCFRVSPHSWTINFGASECGVLYGDHHMPTLRATLKSAFKRAPNAIVECNGVTLAALVAKDAYYIADPCWVGPPLFAQNHGAIYALRCTNENALAYAMTKMLNTNQRLNARVTPLNFVFDCKNVDAESELCVATRKILLRSARKAPGKVKDPVTSVPGAIVVPDEDSHPLYCWHLAEGILKSRRPDYRLRPQAALRPETTNNTIVSTRWHLNLGQAKPLRRAASPLDPVGMERDSAESIDPAFDRFNVTSRISIMDLIATCDDYPRAVDFVSGLDQDYYPRYRIKQLECVSEPISFIDKDARAEFNASNRDIARDIYKTYRHRLPRREAPASDVFQKDGRAEEVSGEVELNEVMMDAAIDDDFTTKMILRRPVITDAEDTQ